MVTRRAAKKRAGRGELGVREVLALPPMRGVDRPKPCPPGPRGVLLVPDGYVGWIFITTPRGRRKPRWLAQNGHVYRDDHLRGGGRYHVRMHAQYCRVEPCDIVPLTAVGPMLRGTPSPPPEKGANTAYVIFDEAQHLQAPGAGVSS